MTEKGPGAETCDNCGAPDAELEPVHRVYLETDSQGRVTGSSAQPEVERWCLSCRTLYPNDPSATSAPGSAGT
ncbi:MAG: hypothetical protein ACYDA2_06750 [Acidimicrobiales bacterium]